MVRARDRNYRLPKGREEREAHPPGAIGGDGFLLLDALDAPGAPAEAARCEWRRRRATVAVHYAREGDGRRRWRAGAGCPAGERLESPYDPEADWSTKRQMEWTGLAGSVITGSAGRFESRKNAEETADFFFIGFVVTGALFFSIVLSGAGRSHLTEVPT